MAVDSAIQLSTSGLVTYSDGSSWGTRDDSYTIGTWVENMTDYLRSAMSYTNCRNLKEFKPNNVDCVIVSNNTYNSVNK